MLKAIKIRIYPNKEQADYINRQLGCCRKLYNSVLGWRKRMYDENKTSPSSTEVSSFIKQLKEELPYLKEVHSKALQQSVIDLNTAYNNFFRGVKKGEKVGFPKYKSKKEYNDSCRFPVDAFIGVNGNRISITRVLSDIHFKCSRRDETYLNKRQKYVKSTTVRRNSANQYYVSVLVDYEGQETPDKGDGFIGIDLGLKDLVITSEGEVFDKLSFIEQKKKMKRYQRQLSKTKSDSKRHHRIRVKLAKVHLKMKNKRNWYHHYVSNSIISDNQVICMEDLNVGGMMKNHKLAEAFQDQGLHSLFTKIEYKCKWQGKDIVQVGRFFPSSKLCHVCGYKKVDLTLNDREWDCPICGEHHNRDVNAALNILEEGIRLYNMRVGLSSPELTHVDYPTVDDKEALPPLKSSGRMNREKNVTK